jgi:hypothetical protein
VDGEVHGAAAELEEVERRPKDGQSGPSMWRRLAADGEPAVEAGTGGRGGWVEKLRDTVLELRDDRRGAGAGCLQRLSDDEHGGVWSST